MSINNINLAELSHAEVHDKREKNESIAEGKVRGYSSNSKGQIEIYLETGYTIKLSPNWNRAIGDPGRSK